MPTACVLLMYQTACWVADIRQGLKRHWCTGFWAQEAIQKAVSEELLLRGLDWVLAMFSVQPQSDNASGLAGSLAICRVRPHKPR
jgi:hypothetical protein